MVVDTEFPSGDLPGIHNALRIEQDGVLPRLVEVQEHIKPFTVRGIAMSNTPGLQRWLRAVDIGGHIRVPVGLATLGRMFKSAVATCGWRAGTRRCRAPSDSLGRSRRVRTASCERNVRHGQSH